MEFLILAILCYFGASFFFKSQKKPQQRHQTNTGDSQTIYNKENNHNFAKGVGTGLLSYILVDNMLNGNKHSNNNDGVTPVNPTQHHETLDHDELTYSNDPLDNDIDNDISDDFDDFDGFDDF